MFRWPVGWVLSVAVGGAAAVATGTTPPAEGPPPDPLRLASASPSLADLGFSTPAGWSLRLDLAYFNLWSGTWHTGTIHQEFGLLGTPLRPWELRTLEERHSGDAIHRYDLEGWVGSVTVLRSTSAGLTMALTVPWLEVGRPHWDNVAWRFHRAVGLDQARRDWFPRGQTVVYAFYGGATIEGWDELNGGRLADATFTVSGPLGTLCGANHRWGLAVQGPVGERGTLAGSGGWDGGVRWGAQWQGARHRLTIAAGYTWLDRGGSFLGAARSHTAYAQLAGEYRLGARTWVDGGVRADSSPLAHFSPSAVGRDAVRVLLGVARPLGRESWVRVELGENLPMLGAAPDFTLGVSVVLGR